MDDINWWVFVAQILNFAILFFAFKYFLWDKIVSAIEERKVKLATIAKIDSEVKIKLAKAKAEEEKLLSEARTKVDNMMNIWEATAKKTKKEILDKAKVEADWYINSARNEIEKEKLTMLKSVKTKVVDLALRLNWKLFKEEKANKDFMAKELEQIS